MILSHYERRGKRAFKCSDIGELWYDVSDLFSELVDHWMRHYGWDRDRDSIYPEEGVWFEGVRGRKKIRIIEDESGVTIEYGIDTDYPNSESYVETVWQREIVPVLERVKGSEIDDFHMVERTLSGLGNEGVVKAV